jgi:hypothetical protein
MKMEQSNGVAPGGAHQASNHDWDTPPPGSGTMKVCRKCGEKQTVYTERAECVGLPRTGLVESQHDYDPFPS